MGRISIVVALLFCALTCVAIMHAEQARDRDPAWMAPSGDAQRLNPLTSRPDVGAGGARIYRQRCSACHAEDGGGTPKAPDLTAPDVQA